MNFQLGQEKVKKIKEFWGGQSVRIQKKHLNLSHNNNQYIDIIDCLWKTQ